MMITAIHALPNKSAATPDLNGEKIFAGYQVDYFGDPNRRFTSEEYHQMHALVSQVVVGGSAQLAQVNAQLCLFGFALTPRIHPSFQTR